MNELRRQQYLQTLGIESYMPRVLFAHAPPPRLCELPLESAAQIPTVPVPATLDPVEPLRTQAAPVSVAAVLRDLKIDSQYQHKTDKRQIPVFAKPVVQAITPAYLHVWRPVPGHLVIDDCPPGMALPTPTLLANILAALACEKRTIATAERMRVPVRAELDKLYTSDDIRQDLHAWLAEEAGQHQITEVWLLGEIAGFFLAPEAELAESLWRYQTITIHQPAITLRALIAPSLSHLLRNPLDKARLWQALQSQ